MSPLLRNLLGNNTRDRELTDEVRAVLDEMRLERERFEALLTSSDAAAGRLQQLADPIAKASADVHTVAARLADVEQRLEALTPVANQIHTLDARSGELTDAQRQAQTQLTAVVEDAAQIRATFETLSARVEQAVDLEQRLNAFLEIDKPFQVLHGEADALRAQVAGTGEHLARLREQHERLVDAHKLATSKMEALDRRREELSRDLQDKERRVVGVDMAVRGLDGVRQTLDDIKRELGTLKALSDAVAQKTTALEVQREAVERALAQAEQLERAMKQLDAGVRQQHENEKSLSAVQDALARLRGLHEEVLERSSEITQLQRQTEEQAGVIRHELTAAQDGMRNAVERFDFESKGVEAVSQRVADLRGALSDFENRYKNLRESSQTVGELKAQTQALTAQVQNLAGETVRIDAETARLHALRRELDETTTLARELGGKVTQLEAARPALEVALQEVEQLRGVYALVGDATEQMRNADTEIARMRETQSETRSWLDTVERSLGTLREQVSAIQTLSPTVEHVQHEAQRIVASMDTVEARRAFVEDLQRKVTELGSLAGALDERGRGLTARMEAAEQRFVSLGAHAEEAERLSRTIAGVSSGVLEATRRTTEITQAVTAIGERCESVEALAESTRALRDEIEQRHTAVQEASKQLQRASKLRQEAVAAAEQLGELNTQLAATLTSTTERFTHADRVVATLEDRITALRTVDQRLAQFEARLATWETVDEEVSKSLEQIVARQGTVQALQSDLDRMVAMAEQTSSDVRTITSAHREIAESRALLTDVQARLEAIDSTTSALDERKRQMAKAEERLARAEGFLLDVRSSLEALQAQKTLVDQAVEKAGSLRFLLKQAEAMIEGLREERQMTADVQVAAGFDRDNDEEDVRAA